MNLKVDLFYRHTYDILLPRELSVPTTFGASLPDLFAGKVLFLGGSTDLVRQSQGVYSGDLSGIAMPGSPTFKHAASLEARAKELGIEDYAYSDNPAVFWDLNDLEMGDVVGESFGDGGLELVGHYAEA